MGCCVLAKAVTQGRSSTADVTAADSAAGPSTPILAARLTRTAANKNNSQTDERGADEREAGRVCASESELVSDYHRAEDCKGLLHRTPAAVGGLDGVLTWWETDDSGGARTVDMD